MIGCITVELLVPGASVRPGLAVYLTRIGDCAYALGPCLILTLFGPTHFSWAAWPIYLAALAAQFVCDVARVGVCWVAEGSQPATCREL
ncbi:MAG: hypothetical protein J2O48_02065, partial [Solirubrobacterales bacterium]|nr:hypothetical protein [Solirubrobacterales bacterium]